MVVMQNKYRCATGLTAVLTISAVGILSASAASSHSKHPSKEIYRVLETWQLGGTGGWDYLTMDVPLHRLFITRADHVDVVDTQTGKITGSIANTSGVHGVALAPELNRGYTSNGKASSVTEFDYTTLAVIREVPIPGQNPDAILFEPSSHRLFTFNGRSKDVTALDASTLAVIGTIKVPDKPEFAVADSHGVIYLNIESEAGQMLAIDARTLNVTATWQLPDCASPSGLALNREAGHLYSVCDGKTMVVTDSRSGKQVQRISIGAGPDAAAYDAVRKLVFSSNGEGTLSVAEAASNGSYAIKQTLQTQPGARTMALDKVSGRIYLVTADFGATPAATAEQPHPRPAQIPNTFKVLVVGPE